MDERIRQNFGINMRQIVVLGKIEVRELSDATGIGLPTLLRYIDGHQMPNDVHRLAIARSFGLSSDRLLGDPSILLTQLLPSFESEFPELSDLVQHHGELIRLARSKGRGLKTDQKVIFAAEYIGVMEEIF